MKLLSVHFQILTPQPCHTPGNVVKLHHGPQFQGPLNTVLELSLWTTHASHWCSQCAEHNKRDQEADKIAAQKYFILLLEEGAHIPPGWAPSCTWAAGTGWWDRSPGAPDWPRPPWWHPRTDRQMEPPSDQAGPGSRARAAGFPGPPAVRLELSF